MSLKREASKIGIQLVSKPSLTIGSLLCSKAKHHLPKLQESNVVYKIECSCQVDGDPVVYIGETDRLFLECMSRVHSKSWDICQGAELRAVTPKTTSGSSKDVQRAALILSHFEK
ncbi:hypothetical protein FJT64_014680 [Amphibalanus amphitrite]|uniref:Uncharacterized protein n=1 Tax=Amphibalanus amphitrite TaxID=1232801 RepID=A0A6A4VB18_AMPAM|nr:hypothetical protein FJT64_014680 [Amphibalanus amphitrite]